MQSWQFCKRCKLPNNFERMLDEKLRHDSADLPEGAAPPMTEPLLADRLRETYLFPEKLLQHHGLLPGVAQRVGTLGRFQGTSAPRLGIQDSAVIARYQVITLSVHLGISRHIPAIALRNLR